MTELWTGIACLVADPNCDGFMRFGRDGKGAYVNVVACVNSEEAFVERVNRHSKEMDCIMIELSNIQHLDSRMEEPDYPEELITVRTTARRQSEDTTFGTFRTWIESDVN